MLPSDVQAIERDEQFISDVFSDPPHQRQNHRGLVKIDKKSLTTSIDNYIIRIYPEKKIVGKVKLFI